MKPREALTVLTMLSEYGLAAQQQGVADGSIELCDIAKMTKDQAEAIGVLRDLLADPSETATEAPLRLVENTNS